MKKEEFTGLVLSDDLISQLEQIELKGGATPSAGESGFMCHNTNCGDKCQTLPGKKED